MVFKTGDALKAESCLRLSCPQRGSMMELQNLQEALKVEIQVHQKLVAQMKQDPQNADLKKQLHELQAKITALSEKQKKVVEQLRKELMVKQDQVELRMQTQQPPQQPPAQQHPPQPDGTASTLPSTQLQPALPLPNLSTPQTIVTGTPVIPSKTLPLVLKAATPNMPTSVVTPRPSVAMVTTLSHMAKPITTPQISDQMQTTTTLGLQATGKLTSQGPEPLRIVSKNTVVVQATSTQTIKVPHFVPPPRLTSRPTFLPQVRPKPATPATTVPIAPAPSPASLPPMLTAPQLLQRPVMLATKVSAGSLSTTTGAPGPITQLRILNGQPGAGVGAALSKTFATAQLTGIVITTPATIAPIQLTTAPMQPASSISSTKVEVIQDRVEPNTPPRESNSISISTSTSSSPAPVTMPSPPPAPKREESTEKLAFMVSLGLVTHDHLEAIQSRRQERKRRTTANPVYSGAMVEPERKKTAVTYLNTPLHPGTRKRGRPPKYSSVSELGHHQHYHHHHHHHPPVTPATTGSHSAPPAPRGPACSGGPPPLPVHPHTLPLPNPSSGDGDIHEDFCTVCRRSGQLLMCDTCSRVYHLDCLDPPLKTIPKGMWICPKCQDQIMEKEEAIPWPGTLAIVHSYIAYKAAKEEEKQKMVKWSDDLKQEREHLEQRVKLLSNSITKCMETKNTVLARQKDMHVSLEKVKGLVRLIQGISLPPLVPDAPPPSNPHGITNGETDHPSSRHTDCGSVGDSINSNNHGDTNSNVDTSCNVDTKDVSSLQNNSRSTDKTPEPEPESEPEVREDLTDNNDDNNNSDNNNSSSDNNNDNTVDSSDLSKTPPEPPQAPAIAPIAVEGAK